MSDLIDRQATQPDTRDTNVGNTTTKNVIYSPVQMAMDYAVNATDFSASSDTISRQDAIDVVKHALAKGLEPTQYIEELPSAQPEKVNEQIKWERDIAVQQLKALGYGLGEKIRTDSDTISRQTAIDDIETVDPSMILDVEWVKNWVKALPSAQPEQRWIPWSSGKLPEESGTYTVTAYDGVTKRVTYAKYQKRLKRWELTGARAYWRVLAWMPLPEPYREEGE